MEMISHREILTARNIFEAIETNLAKIWHFSVILKFSKAEKYKKFDNNDILKYRGGPISPNVLKFPNLTYAISRFLAKIIPVSISPKVPNIAEFAEIADFF
jgi:hypothetical protein